MSSGGAVQLVDIAQCSTPEALAEAIKGAMQTNGFIFILNHGLEKQAEEMFAISGEFHAAIPP
jgi:isopenicillin N synthase-like dioxygenase